MPAQTADQFDLRLSLPDAAATTRLGEALARCVAPGDTLLLEGPIGAGKSHLARALIQSAARLAGQPVPDVPSPTYTLIQSYLIAGTEPGPGMKHERMLVHADLYRLGDPSELEELGLSEAIGRDTCLVEWPDRMAGLAPDDALRIRLDPAGEGRQAHLSGPVARWSERLAPLLEEAPE